MKHLIITALLAVSLFATAPAAKAADWETPSGQAPKIYCSSLRASVELLRPRNVNRYQVTYTTNDSTSGGMRAYSCSFETIAYIPDSPTHEFWCKLTSSSQGTEYVLNGREFSELTIGSNMSAAVLCAQAYTQLGIKAVKK